MRNVEGHKGAESLGLLPWVKTALVIRVDLSGKIIAFCMELDLISWKLVKKSKLTTNQHYYNLGMTRFKKQVQSWLTRYWWINEEPSEANSSGNLDERQQSPALVYLEMFVCHYEVIWSGKMPKQWRRDKSQVYCLSKKPLETFVNRVLGD